MDERIGYGTRTDLRVALEAQAKVARDLLGLIETHLDDQAGDDSRHWGHFGSLEALTSLLHRAAETFAGEDGEGALNALLVATYDEIAN